MVDSSNGNSDLCFLPFRIPGGSNSNFTPPIFAIFSENGNLRGCSLRFGFDENGRIALFQIVLGLTPRRRPCKACPSQNDDFLPRFGIYPLQTALQGTSIPKRFGTTERDGRLLRVDVKPEVLASGKEVRFGGGEIAVTWKHEPLHKSAVFA